MIWQDIYFALSGLVYTLVMLPSCWDPKTEVPRSTSLLTFLTMLSGSFVYLSLAMPLASASNAVGALPWLYLCLWRPIR